TSVRALVGGHGGGVGGAVPRCLVQPAARPPAASAGLAARRGGGPLRAAGPLLGGLLQGPAERLLLLPPLHDRLPAAARGRVGSAPAALGPDRGRDRGERLCPYRQ